MKTTLSTCRAPLALLGLALATLCATAAEPSLTLFAAASTSEVMTEAAQGFARQSGIMVKITPASSGALARQIAAGAPADLFLSASSTWSDWLLEQKGLRPESVRELMRNRLVIVAGREVAPPVIRFVPEFAFADAFRGRLSIGDPEHVPAGLYAAEALKAYGWDQALANRLLPAQDVRAAMLMVELGQCDLGIVYATDAALSKKVRTVAIFPETAHSPIVYTLGICQDTRAADDAKAFWTYVQTPEVALMLRRYGFVPTPPAGE